MTSNEQIAGRPRGLGLLPLIAIGGGVFIFSHDFISVSIAIPEIQAHFSSNLQTVQWAITVFSICIAIAMVPAGRFADIFGATNTFVVGVFAFGVTSAVVVIAPAMWVVLVGRGLQGLAAGVVWISAIPLAFEAFGPKRAALAGAFLVGAGGIGSALGPIDAGLLIDWLGWRASFAINVPVCLFAGLVMLRHRSPAVVGRDRTIDWTGISILAASLMALLVTLRYAPEWQWGSARTIGGFMVAAGLVAVLAVRQRVKVTGTLVPPEIVANRYFAVSFAGETLLGMSYFAVIGLCPQIFRNVLDVSTLTTGLMLAPSLVAFSISAAITGRLCGGLSPRVSVPAAGAIAALGGLLLALMPDSPTYLSILPGLLLVGIGTGSAFSSLVAIGVSSVSEEQGGLAGGLLCMSQLAGGAIGLGGVTAVVSEVAAGSAEGFPGAALVQGVQSGFLIAALVGGFGVLVTILGYGLAARRRPVEVAPLP